MEFLNQNAARSECLICLIPRWAFNTHNLVNCLFQRLPQRCVSSWLSRNSKPKVAQRRFQDRLQNRRYGQLRNSLQGRFRGPHLESLQGRMQWNL